MALEEKELINNYLILGAERALQLRDQQREIRARGGITEGNTIYGDDEQIREFDQIERDFQRDKPIRAADLLEMGEYGADEADLQQVTSGRIESLAQVDQSGIGDDNRDAKKYRGARRDNLPQKIGVWMETPSGKKIYVAGQNEPNSRVDQELREATILQELGLASPPREQIPYQTNKKGQRRRNFGTVLKDGNDEVVKETLKRVKKARPSGQLQNPEDVISVDKFPTAKRKGYRGIGPNGPQEMSKTSNVPMRGQIGTGSAYQRLVDGINSGEVEATPENLRLLDRMLESGDPQTANRNATYAGREAVQENYPVTKESLLRREATRQQTEARLRQEAASAEAKYGRPGSTREVIGETVMSDEAWKSKSQKEIPTLPVVSKVDSISDQQVYQMVNEAGDVVGYGNGARFIESPNKANPLQNLNVPPNQQGLINFITENLQYNEGGGLKDATITTATQDFTDIARQLTKNRFGAGVEKIPSGINSIAEAQTFVDRLIERGLKQATPFSRYNPEDPSNPIKVPRTETPTVSDLMSTMNVDRSTQGRLANALYQMALSEGIDINQEGKQRYGARQGSYQPVYNPEGFSETVDLDAQSRGEVGKTIPGRQNITFDSPAGVFYDGVDAAYIPNSQRKKIDGENINIQAALRQLKDPDARSPFIGAVAREPQPKERYRKGFGQDVSIEKGYTDLERSMAKGKRKYNQSRVDKNIQLAREVEERFNRGEEDRAVRRVMSQADSSLADERFARDNAEDYANYDRSRNQMLDSIREGKSLPGRQSGDDGFRVSAEPTRPAPTRERPSGMISYNNQDPMIAAQARRIGMSPKQPIQEAPTPSIAPTPGDITGNQQAPMVDAGQGNQFREVAPDLGQLKQIDASQTKRYGDFSQEAVPPILAEGRRRKRSSARPYSETKEQGPNFAPPQGPQIDRSPRTREQRIDQIKNIGRRMAPGYSPYTRGAYGGAAAAAGLTGLAALIGGERDQREQEQYS